MENSVYQIGAEFPPPVFSVGADYSLCVCVLQRRSKILMKQSHMVKLNVLTIQTSEELLLAALVYCVSFGDRNPRIPFVPTHSRLRRCGIFPLFFWLIFLG